MPSPFSATLDIPQTIDGYKELIEWLDDLKIRTKTGSEYVEAYRWFGLNDLYFLFRHILLIGRQIHQPYGNPIYDAQLYVDMARNTEFQISMGGGINTSSRRIAKSELRTCAALIQIGLKYPDMACGIVSVEKSLGLRHLRRIKTEFEKNELLKFLYPDILWEDPQEEAKSNGITWSLQDGLTLRGRSLVRSNATYEVNALFGGGPVGSGYDVVAADDIERRDRVETQNGIDELETAFSEAISLLTPFVMSKPILLMSNTSFAENGLVAKKVAEFSAVDPRLAFEVPAEIIEEKHEWCMKYVLDINQIGPLGGHVVYPFTAEFLRNKYLTMARRIEYCRQYALSSRSTGDTPLDENLIHFFDQVPAELARDFIVYVNIDPSKGRHDPSAIWAWGLSFDKRKFWIDGIISNLDITTQEFHNSLFAIISKWNNLSVRVTEVRVEDTANSDWAALVERELRSRGCYVPVVKLVVKANQADRKFKTGKHDRIYQRWAPMLNAGEVWFPTPVSKGGRGIMCDMKRDGNLVDLVDYMIATEIRPFPAGKHDDGLDAGGMIADEKRNQDAPLQYPAAPESRRDQSEGRMWGSRRASAGWMSAG